MPLRESLLITFATTLLTSLVAVLVWRWVFSADIPAFVIGAVGGITAAATWHLLKRLYPKQLTHSSLHMVRREVNARPRGMRRRLRQKVPLESASASQIVSG